MESALVFATCLAPNVRPTYEYVAASVGRRLGVETTLVDCTDYGRLDPPQEDVHFVCSLPYIHLARRPRPPIEVVAAPVLLGERYEDRPIYFSDVIVRAGTDIRSFADLRGRSWAYNEPMSHSGYGVVRYHLVELGETEGFFGEVVEAGYHQDAIEMVHTGKVDGSAIDSQVLEIEMRDRSELRDELRVIDSLGPSTIQPVTVASRLPEDLKEGIRDALVSLADHPEAREPLARGLVKRFVPMSDEDYTDIRTMLEICERAGFLELR